jgi:hypothetical protein
MRQNQIGGDKDDHISTITRFCVETGILLRTSDSYTYYTSIYICHIPLAPSQLETTITVITGLKALAAKSSLLTQPWRTECWRSPSCRPRT